MCQDDDMKNLKKIIKIQYEDDRKIIGYAENEILKTAQEYGIYADIIETEENELITLNIQDEDFDDKELEKYKKYGEELYEKTHKLVSIYLLCTQKCINKMDTWEIEFDERILIKIAKMEYSDAYQALRHMEVLVRNKEKFGKDDLDVLSMIPLMGPPEDLRYMRMECLKLWKEINEKGLIK